MAGTILITGVTGTIASVAATTLTAHGAVVRGTTRDPEKLVELNERGLEAVVMDFANPESVAAAVDGVECVFLVSAQHPEQTTLQGNVVAAAVEASVNHIVKVSGASSVTGRETASFIGRSHREIETQIEEMGVPYTFLHPNYFMQNLLRLTGTVRTGTLVLPVGDARIAIVDAEDVGLVAAAVLAHPEPHTGRTYDITGPEALLLSEVASSLSALVGHEVTHVSPPIEVVVGTMKANGAPDWLQQHVREIMTIFATDPAVSKITDVVRSVTGGKPATIDAFFRRHATEFGGSPSA